MIPIPEQGNVIPRSPNTELRLYSGVPWDNSYQHVRLYNDRNDLLNHLEQWRVTAPAIAENTAPIRIGSLEVRVPYNEMSILNLNYLAFRNHTSSDNRNNIWTFCFITGINWKSEKTTTVYFELDIFQNNIYDCAFRPCFVEQAHIPKEDDVIGGNLIPVSLETGEPYAIMTEQELLPPKELCAYVAQEGAGGTTEGSIVNNVYRAASLAHYNLDSQGGGQWAAEQMNDLITRLTNAGNDNAILNVFMCPEICVNAEVNEGNSEITVNVSMPDDVFEGYKPKNNKVYSYPFVYLLVNNHEGKVNQYNYEFSDKSDHSISFTIQGSLCTAPQVICFPTQYNGYFIDYMDMLTISNFPQCAFTSDVYKAWIAQNKNTIALQQAQANTNLGLSVAGTIVSGLSAAGSAAAIGATGGAAGAILGQNIVGSVQGVMGGVQSSFNSLYAVKSIDAMKQDKKVIPPNVHGQTFTDSLNAARNLTGFDFITMSCRREFAEMIDDYFTVFGYPIQRVMTPDMRTRSAFNYIKTQNCGLYGGVELNQLSQLRYLFDRGITIWHTDQVGNYGLNNN